MATTLEGTLLGSDYLTVGERAWVRLWLRTPEGPAAVLDPTFEPYFYTVPEGEVDAEQLAKRLEAVTADGKRPERCDVVTRHEGLDQVRVVQVVARHPSDVPALREKFRKEPGVASTREDDVLFANRYLIDRGLVPLTRIRCEVEPSERMEGAWQLQRAEIVDERFPELHVLAFDIEVYNPNVTPDPNKDPILVITLADNAGRTEVLVKDDHASDKAILERFVALVQEIDPDVLVAYNGDNFDWPYLAERAGKHRVRLAVGRDGSEPTIRQAGRDKAVRVTGRANVDAYQIVQRDLPDVKVKTLERVAEHLGVMDRADRTNLDSRHMAAIWDDQEQREELLAYATDDVAAALGIAERLLPLQVGLCRRTYQDLSDGSRMGRGRQADWYLLAEAHRRQVLAPDKRSSGPAGTQYEGGVVLEPPAGIHEDIVYLDFSSMYPSIMVAHNVSPDTYVPLQVEPAGDVWTAPQVGHRFLKAPDGFFKRLLEELLGARRELKAKMAELDKDSREHTLLKVEEQAVKVLTNAFYGYMGWAGARWQSMPCAEATTAWGRHFIQRVVDMANEAGIDVLYGDTDSVMVREHAGIPAFMERVNAELPVELEVEARFDVLFFTGAKKRYAGRTDDGTTIVRGLEVRRGDWCDLAKQTQQAVIEALLDDKDPEAATAIALEAVASVREGRVDPAQLTIHKTLTTEPGAYKAKQPHAEAVLKAQAAHPGFRAPLGAKVGYVITKGSGLISDRARLVDFLEEGDEIDADYYIENQLLPAALRVLEYFGVSEDELLGRPQQKSLNDWFG